MSKHEDAALRAITQGENAAKGAMDDFGSAVPENSRAFVHRTIAIGAAIEALAETAPACGTTVSEAARALVRLLGIEAK